MKIMTDSPIRFPGLFGDWAITISSRAIDIGNGIYWYGILIALGMLVALWWCMRQRTKYGIREDDLIDGLLWGIPCGIIGARLYYVAMTWELFRDNPVSILYIWEGGIAIYGGVIGGAVTTALFCKIRKIKFLKTADTAILGLVWGQALGRWGNFFNREAFGGYTDGLLAMQLPVSAVRDSDISKELAEHIVEIGGVSYIQVHPTFLYESLWNLVLLVILLLIRKRKKFEGEIFLLYLAGYGIGRAWIEGLRTDQLLIPGTSVAVSQVLAVVLAVVSVMMLIILRKKAVSRKQQ